MEANASQLMAAATETDGYVFSQLVDANATA